MGSEGSNVGNVGRLTIGETAVTVELGNNIDLMFSKPTDIDRDQVNVILLGTKENISVTVNSKSILGALKALEAGHDRRKVHEEGRDRWERSLNPRQSAS